MEIISKRSAREVTGEYIYQTAFSEYKTLIEMIKDTQLGETTSFAINLGDASSSDVQSYTDEFGVKCMKVIKFVHSANTYAVDLSTIYFTPTVRNKVRVYIRFRDIARFLADNPKFRDYNLGIYYSISYKDVSFEGFNSQSYPLKIFDLDDIREGWNKLEVITSKITMPTLSKFDYIGSNRLTLSLLSKDPSKTLNSEETKKINDEFFGSFLSYSQNSNILLNKIYIRRIPSSYVEVETSGS